jgi:hypothetical protein
MLDDYSGLRERSLTRLSRSRFGPRILLLHRRDRHHSAVPPLTAQPAQEYAHQHRRIQTIRLRPRKQSVRQAHPPNPTSQAPAELPPAQIIHVQAQSSASDSPYCHSPRARLHKQASRSPFNTAPPIQLSHSGRYALAMIDGLLGSVTPSRRRSKLRSAMNNAISILWR